METSSPVPAPDARVPSHVFLGVLWAGTSTSLFFVAFRLFVRIRSFGKLLSDDYFVIVAWAMLLAYSIIWQKQAPALYDQYAIASGKMPIYPEFLAKDEKLIHSIAPLTILFYTCIWSVKLGFLLFFKRLGYEIRIHKIWWWCVLFVTVSSYVACIGDINYKCSLSPLIYIISHCTKQEAIQFNNRTFYANCALDGFSDFCILSIPIMILWNVRIPLKKKLILFALFAAILVIVVVSIVRVVVVHSRKENVDISWLYLWSNVEMTTAITIACVASFRQLFVHSHSKNEQRPAKTNGLGTGTWSSKTLFSYFTSTPKRPWKNERLDSQTRIVPLNNIHVKYNVDITDAPKGNDNELKSPYEFPSPHNDNVAT